MVKIFISYRLQAPHRDSAPLRSKPDASAEALRAIIGGPFDWCEVPAGEFLYGNDFKRRLIDGSLVNQPLKTLTLPVFLIAKYPITYSQFQVFIDAQDGFKDQRWWEGQEFNQSDEPGDQRWEIADHPRESVSWHDAIAFCRWLSFRLGGGYAIDKVDEWLVRLPTEFEWEKAARGTDGRLYPYGNDFDVSKANTIESGIFETTPVTAYPHGASPYGVMAMSGNVWEWCLTDYDNPVVEVGNEDISSDSWRVVRGGSWYATYVNACTAYRVDFDPSYRDDNCGFRIMRPLSHNQP